MLSGRASEVGLPAPDARALERMLAAEGERVMQACAALDLKGRICALAFLTTDDEPIATVGYASALTEDRRDEICSEGDFSGLWSPSEWDHPDFLDYAPERALEGGTAVGGSLVDAGCEDPESAFARELAYRINRADWTPYAPLTDDFICTASDHELVEIKHNVQLLGRPEAARAWADKGWLHLATLRPDALPQLDPTIPKVPGLDEVFIDLGATPEQAQQISAALRVTIYDLDELDDWLDEPGFDGWLDDDEYEKLGKPDWTARDAMRAGRIDLVLAVARGEAGE